jgi:hypothetical protein
MTLPEEDGVIRGGLCSKSEEVCALRTEDTSSLTKSEVT